MFNRRVFLERSGKVAATLSLMPKVPLAFGSETTPHFFLQVFIDGGADSSYLFDSRDQSFSAAGKIQNYRTDKNIHLWEDSRGGKTWVSSIAQSLADERPNFSVLNGVHMAQGFDGHPQNVALMITGNTSGGKLFVTDFPKPSEIPLSFLAQGRFQGFETPSLEQGVSLKASTARKLGERFRSSGAPDPSSRAFAFIKQRAALAAGSGSGAASRGAGDLARGFDGVADIATKQAAVRLCAQSDSCDRQFLIEDNASSALNDSVKTAFEYFSRGLTQSALISIQYDLDTHDATQAKAQPGVFTKLVADLKNLFQALRQPFDAQRGLSFADVTTVLISSEFSRSMRQTTQPIDNTGTDHNPYTNTVLLAGRGIRKGLIVGATDLDRIENGELTGVTPLHRVLDPELIKPVGRPLDHASLEVSEVMPETFDPSRFLTYLSVINTVYSLFQVPEALYKAPTRTAAKAPVLNGLLV